MQEREARSRLEASATPEASFGTGMLVSTFAVRHPKGLDVVFLLDGIAADFQIGMGAASDDFSSILSIGVDDERGALRATGSHTMNGRRRTIPVRIVYRSASVIAVDATPLPLRDRPASLKCWSFVRRGAFEHYSDVIGLVSPALETLPEVPLKTRPRE